MLLPGKRIAQGPIAEKIQGMGGGEEGAEETVHTGEGKGEGWAEAEEGAGGVEEE